jgi:isopenicillin N synthase-like dioxygenase
MMRLAALLVSIVAFALTDTWSSEVELPIIDISLISDSDWSSDPNRDATIESIRMACEEMGFFYINTGLDFELIERLQDASHRFFSKSVEEKEQIAMKNSGKAWRGFFKVGDELTSGKKDMKEGLYFGKEEEAYSGSMPLRGKNIFPGDDLQFKDDVLEYMKMMKGVAHTLMKAISTSLGADLEEHFAVKPTELFRIFSYPSPKEDVTEDVYGVGEHTDYGFLTILFQDASGGLQVKARSENGTAQWLDVPPLPGTHVVNLGDALEHYTHGRFRATPHRVIYHGRKASSPARLSFPYFFDPHFEAPMLPMAAAEEGRNEGEAGRWDGADPTQFEGTYGDYLQRKISRVFPQLFANSISSEGEL